MDGFGHDGTCDVGASPGKCLHTSVRHRPVESGYHRLGNLRKPLGQKVVRPFAVKIPFLIEADNLCGIDEGEAQILCHQNSVQVLPSGRGIVSARLLAELCADSLKFPAQVNGKAKPCYNLIVARPLFLELFLILVVHRGEIIAPVQHIRYFGITWRPFSRGRRNHVPAGFFLAYNSCSLLELLCACQ